MLLLKTRLDVSERVQWEDSEEGGKESGRKVGGKSPEEDQWEGSTVG